MDYLDKYDLRGMHGAEVFRDLPEGVRVELVGGALGEIIANARDGAIVEVRILSDPNDPGRVGSEEMIYFPDVLGVVSESPEEGVDE